MSKSKAQISENLIYNSYFGTFFEIVSQPLTKYFLIWLLKSRYTPNSTFFKNGPNLASFPFIFGRSNKQYNF